MAVDHGDLGYEAIDADNHYYEPLDAFTRHLDPAFARRGVEVVTTGRRTRMLAGGDTFEFIPNPTFDPIIVPGCIDPLFRGQIPEGVDPRIAHAGRAAASRVPGPRRPPGGDGRTGPGHDRAVPDHGLRRRGGPQGDIARHHGHPLRLQLLARRGLGLRSPGPHRQRPDAVPRRPRGGCGRARPGARRRRPHRPCPARARCPGEHGTSRSLGHPAHDPFWARLAETVDTGGVPPRRQRLQRLHGDVGRLVEVPGLRPHQLAQQGPGVGPGHPRHHGLDGRRRRPHPLPRPARRQHRERVGLGRPAGEAPPEAGQPDAVGLRRGPPRRHPPQPLGDAVLRGGRRRPGRAGGRREDPLRLRLAPRRGPGRSRSTS